MYDAINIFYRIMSALIAVGFIVKALASKNRAEQLVSSFVMLAFLLRSLGLK